jgi:NIPSNAP
MRTYELRAYTLSSGEALDRYRTVNYLRHLTSFAHHDIGLHGLWTAQDGSPVLYALVSYAGGEDPETVTKRFMSSAEFRADVDGLDVSMIVGVTTTLLKPSPGSPLL